MMASLRLAVEGFYCSTMTRIHGLYRLKDGKGKVKLSKQEQDAARRREQMAAAAEARIARLQLISGQQQLWC